MKEKQLLDFIQEKTGKELHKDYYFVLGTQTPFMDYRGMLLMQIPKEGFLVVDKATDESKGFTITPDNVDTYVNDIVEFLQAPKALKA